MGFMYVGLVSKNMCMNVLVREAPMVGSILQKLLPNWL